ncbi:tyrosine-type recombinase/integrase [Streptomyces sp. NPDC059256]|uniref:tyrosine-type recombinase/integrase n=1 Tax=Streptomyces sp. NPDC059256 TaxID=3346794 RepID=UPI003674D138
MSRNIASPLPSSAGAVRARTAPRTVVLPEFLHTELRRHMAWYAEKEADGLVFVGEKGAPFRRSTFGRTWWAARAKVGMEPNFRFYDLRHTGYTLLAETGASTRDLMVRMGQSSVRAAMIYQHSTAKRQKELAGKLDDRVRTEIGRARPSGEVPASGARVVRPS